MMRAAMTSMTSMTAVTAMSLTIASSVFAGVADGEKNAKSAAEYAIFAAAIPPYTTVNGSGVDGILAEVVREMARRSGHSGRIELTSWNRAQQLVRDSSDNLPRFIIPLTRTPEREAQYQWIAPILSDDAVIVTMKGTRARIINRNQLAGLRVGALLGSPLAALLKKDGLGTLDAGATEETNAKKLKSGHIDAWFVARKVAPFVFKAEGYDPAQLDYGIVLRRNDLYLAASRNMPRAEVEKWQKAFAAMKKDGSWKRITSR
ncbi:MAG: hypothetical protein RIQ81_657 [Pseudomonadota bacterium]|jgi:polar amino acid transport system substrate-binding protein